MFTRQKEDQKENDWLKEYSEEVKKPIVIPVKDWTLTKALWYRLNKPLGGFSQFMLLTLAFFLFMLWSYFIKNEFIIK